MTWAAFQLLLAIWAAAALVMGWGHRNWRRGGKAGLVDVLWAYGVGLGGVTVSLLSLDAHPVRRGVAALAIGLWSLRLGTMLARRVRSRDEDGRYAALIAHFGPRAPAALFVFFQAQAFWVALFVLPIAAALSGAAADPGPSVSLAVGLALLAVGGEALADAQLARFRARPEHRGQVCRDGLWAWSRHPNYFFEWTFWWTFVALGFGAPGFPWTLSGPVVMGLFLFRVTGIPYTEKQALASRGEAYREYQRTTSVFVPWPPRKSAS